MGFFYICNPLIINKLPFLYIFSPFYLVDWKKRCIFEYNLNDKKLWYIITNNKTSRM